MSDRIPCIGNGFWRAVAAALVVLCQAAVARAEDAMIGVPAARVTQIGSLPPGLEDVGQVVLANEPQAPGVGIAIEVDLESVPQTLTPLARLELPDVTKLKVARPGKPSSTGRGALHVSVAGVADPANDLAGTTAVKPAGIATNYTIDVTSAVSEALARPAGQRRIALEVRMTGQPAWYEVYGVPIHTDKPIRLQIAPADNWKNDWDERLAPITSGSTVYREGCIPLTPSRDTELPLRLVYPAARIIEVIHNGTGEKLQEGRDWVLRDGTLVLPPGSRAPVQVESEFFLRMPKPATGPATQPVQTRPTRVSVQLMEGTWYHERQIEVSYEPAVLDWALPPPVASIDNLPRLKRRLAEKAPLRIVLFGDSISYGGNASKVQGAWPYQPAFGELVAWKLQQHYGNNVVFMNHSRGGATSAWATTQAESQVGWFKPDLAIIGYGMNDRAENRRGAYRENLEKIIDSIRTMSPDTEFILVTSMLNNPKQPAGLDPVLFLRDEAMKISRPGLALVDMTTTHQKLLERKSYLDTSGNGANHPNDYLHRLYAQRILEVLIPRQ